jgi:hypothetical protein
MNRYMMVCRLRWPAVLLLTGVIALLDQADILSWGHAWPLYLILFGVLALAERAMLASEPPPGFGNAGFPMGGYPPAGYPAQAPASAAPAAPAAAPATSSTGIVPASTDLSIQSSKDEEGR